MSFPTDCSCSIGSNSTFFREHNNSSSLLLACKRRIQTKHWWTKHTKTKQTKLSKHWWGQKLNVSRMGTRQVKRYFTQNEVIELCDCTSCKWKSLKKAALGCRVPSRTSSSSPAHFCSISAMLCSCLIRPLSRLNTSFITSHRCLYSSPFASVTCSSSSPCTVLVSLRWLMTHRSTTSSMASGWRAWRKLGRRVGAATPEWIR